MSGVVGHLRAHPVLAIMRGVPAEHVVALGRALVAGGVRSIEVAFTDVDASDKIAMLVAALGDAGSAGRAGSDAADVLIGAGTVTSRERAAAAVAAGAAFLVTPHVAPDVHEYARAHEMTIVCGAATPTEMAQARAHGATLIKLFPAGPLGPAYLQALLGPYPDLEVFAVGGIGVTNARSYLEAGAVGLGIGGALTSLDWTSPDFGAVAGLARELVELVKNAKEERR